VAVALRLAPRTAESPLGVGRTETAASSAAASPMRSGKLHNREHAIPQARRVIIIVCFPYDHASVLFHRHDADFPTRARGVIKAQQHLPSRLI
jgi:hypothetical protein